MLGTPIGLLMGLNKWAKGVFDTPIEFYWPLPPLAYLPLMIIWLGIGETSKIALLALAMFAPIVLSAQAGVRSVSQERVNAALLLGATQFQLLREIVLPSALPEILTGIRISLGVGWGTLVAAELIAATRGIGYLIMSASQFLANGRRLCRHRNHRGLRLRIHFRHAPPRSLARPLERAELKNKRELWQQSR